MASIDSMKAAVREYLSGLGLDDKSIGRIVEEDLPYLTEWVLEPSAPADLEQAKAIIAFAFGFGPAKNGVTDPPDQYHPLLYEPGASNEALADLILPFARKGLAVFAQWEIAEALGLRGVDLPRQQVARPGKTYLGTAGVVRQFLEGGLGQFDSLIVVAHCHHAYRCIQVTRATLKKGGQIIPLLIPPGLPAVYDSGSVQPWTRSLGNWVSYEVGNRFSNRYRGDM